MGRMDRAYPRVEQRRQVSGSEPDSDSQPLPHLVYGWGRMTLEQGTTGFGVLGFSPRWPRGIGVSGKAIGALVMYRGEQTAIPDELSAQPVSLRHAQIGTERVIARLTADSPGRQGGWFAHLVALGANPPSARQLILLWDAPVPWFRYSDVPRELPTVTLSPIELAPVLEPLAEKGRRKAADTLLRFDRNTRQSVIDLSVALLHATVAGGPAVMLEVDRAADAQQLLMVALWMLPDPLVEAVTFSTFEADITDGGPIVATAVNGISTVSRTTRVHIAPGRPTEQRDMLGVGPAIEELAEALASGSREGAAIDRITSIDELVLWTRIRQALKVAPTDLDDLSMATVFSDNEAATLWFEKGGALDYAIGRALVSDDAFHYVANVLARVGSAVQLSHLMGIALEFAADGDPRVERALALCQMSGVDRLVLDEQLADVLFSRAKKGRPVPIRLVEAVWPPMVERLENSKSAALPTLVADPAFRAKAVHDGPGWLSRHALIAELGDMGSAGSGLADEVLAHDRELFLDCAESMLAAKGLDAGLRSLIANVDHANLNRLAALLASSNTTSPTALVNAFAEELRGPELAPVVAALWSRIGHEMRLHRAVTEYIGNAIGDPASRRIAAQRARTGAPANGGPANGGGQPNGGGLSHGGGQPNGGAGRRRGGWDDAPAPVPAQGPAAAAPAQPLHVYGTASPLRAAQQVDYPPQPQLQEAAPVADPSVNAERRRGMFRRVFGADAGR